MPACLESKGEMREAKHSKKQKELEKNKEHQRTGVHVEY